MSRASERLPTGIPAPIVLLTVLMIAMALLPWWALLRIERTDALVRTLEPARDLATELSALHSRQMSRFQEYMLTGSPSARAQYDRLVQSEGEIKERLRMLLLPLDLEVRTLVLPVTDAVAAWQVGHVTALTGIDGPANFLPEIPADRARYDDVVAADRELVTALTREVQAARATIDGARRLQSILTFGLAALALLGTFALLGVARRLRALIVESRGRRDDAVRTRREVDAILDATADAVLSVDLDGRTGRINPAAERLLGFSDPAARGRTVHDLLHGDEADHDASACPVEAAVRGSRAVDAEEGTIRVRGSTETVPVLWSVRPLLDGRERRGAVVTLADLTEIKEAEARLRSAISAREEVLAVVSHDLRSPLGTVMAATELLLEVPLEADKRAHHLRAIVAATERMNRLIEDLLDVARIDAGGLRVERRAVRIDELVRRAREAAEVESRERGVVVARDGDVPEVEVRVDPDRVLQALQNLVGNALRHTPRGGRVGIGVDLRDGVRLAVSDTGAGIDPDHLSHLFDRFWQPEEGEAGGAGLGLAIVKGVAEAHGGSVEVESTLGEGSRFTLHLPDSDVVAPVRVDPGVSPAPLSTPEGRSPGSS